MRRHLDQHPQVVKVGLPHKGTVDVFGDLQHLPIRDAATDLLVSSSVLEHVKAPEAAVAEMARVISDQGLVYCEVPFMRGWHMAPDDYQRYSLTGVKALFARHGFDEAESGVCSGPVNAWVLLIRDAAAMLMPGFVLKGIMFTLVGWLLHPLKRLDRLLERTEFAAYQPCNVYYLGRRNRGSPAVPE